MTTPHTIVRNFIRRGRVVLTLVEHVDPEALPLPELAERCAALVKELKEEKELGR